MDEQSRIRIVIIEAQSESAIGHVLRELGEAKKVQRINIEKVDALGDTYNINGPVAAVGPNARSENDLLIQAAEELVPDSQLARFAIQLESVRLAMKERAAGSPTADEEVGQVAKAQIAAERGDRVGVLSHLKGAGVWTLAIAKDVGAEIVAQVLTRLLGLG